MVTVSVPSFGVFTAKRCQLTPSGSVRVPSEARFIETIMLSEGAALVVVHSIVTVSSR